MLFIKQAFQTCFLVISWFSHGWESLKYKNNKISQFDYVMAGLVKQGGS